MPMVAVPDHPTLARAGVAAIISRIAAMDAVMDAALGIAATIPGPTHLERSGTCASAATISSNYLAPSVRSMSWSISAILNVRGALRTSVAGSHPADVFGLEAALQTFRLALKQTESIAHRGHELEAAVLRQKAPYLEPEVWVREYGSYGAVLVALGLHPAAVQWLQEQCEQLHPIYDLTDIERRDWLLSFVREEQRALRKPGA